MDLRDDEDDNEDDDSGDRVDKDVVKRVMHTAFLFRDKGATGEAVFIRRAAFGDTRASRELAAADQCCAGMSARAKVEAGGAHQLSSFVANGERIRTGAGGARNA